MVQRGARGGLRRSRPERVGLASPVRGEHTRTWRGDPRLRCITQRRVWRYDGLINAYAPASPCNTLPLQSTALSALGLHSRFVGVEQDRPETRSLWRASPSSWPSGPGCSPTASCGPCRSLAPAGRAPTRASAEADAAARPPHPEATAADATRSCGLGEGPQQNAEHPQIIKGGKFLLCASTSAFSTPRSRENRDDYTCPLLGLRGKVAW